MSTSKSLFFVLLICSQSCIYLVESSRILCVYSMPFDSHQSVFQVITEELARRGHELVVITPIPHRQPLQNVTQIDISDISYAIWDNTYAKLKSHASFSSDPVTFYREVAIEMMKVLLAIDTLPPNVDALMQDKEQHFDVILVEACVIMNMIFAARFNAPVILVSSFFGTESNLVSLGAAVHPILLPDFLFQNFAFNSVWDRFSALYEYGLLRFFEKYMEMVGNTLIRKHLGDEGPNIQNLKKNIQMLILNVHHIWDNNRPVPPSVVYLGAVHLKKPKTIPEEIQKYLDLSQNGVIYVSLGSKIRFSDLPPPTLRVIFNVFSSLPYDFLIKWNGNNILSDKPANIRFEKWLPQNDMLHHPKIKLFITQGGLQSTDEAIAAKVPLLALPILADQFYNAHKYVQHGIGMMLPINRLEEDALRDAIIKLAEDKSCRTNLTFLSQIMENQREGALEKAMRQVEYIATNGNANHLRSPLADASMRDYLLLDYVALIGLVLVACSYIVFKISRAIVVYLIVPLLFYVKDVVGKNCVRKLKSQ